jgi:hypothetical protein
MRSRSWRRLAAVAIVVAAGSAPVAGQQRAGESNDQQKESWTPPRTAWGHPDLQGTFLNATITPLERPTALADKPFLTPEEAAELERQTLERREEAEAAPARPGDIGSYNAVWFDQGTTVVSTLQTSLVVDPPNGRVPVKPEAEAIRRDNLDRIGDSYVHMSLWDRCITRGMPGAMFPAGYNNAYQIFQTPDFVVIHHEMIHEARIVPVDGRPPLPDRIRQWMGDSRGRWEGDTLVIETANFTDKGWIGTSAATGRIKGITDSETLKVVERLTPTAPDTILYQVTVEDPARFEQPWTVQMPLTRDQNYRLYEYACHEGNYAVSNILSGARHQEREAGTAPQPR